MDFLNPYALWTAAVFLPALLVLYFLKLRRTEVIVGSTYLWRKSIQDLQVNSLFQRLRKNLLLFLQMLFLICVILALAVPGCDTGGAGGRSLIIVIDNSASMAATDVDGADNRLELVKREAGKLLRGLWTREDDARGVKRERPPDEAMIIAFSDRTEIVSPFSRDTGALQEALSGVKVRHAGSDLAGALAVVRGQAENRRNAPHVYLFTDGKVGRTAELALKVAKLEVVIPQPTARSSDNLGIASFSVIRSPGDAPLQAVAQLVNASDKPLTTELAVTLDGQPLPVALAPVTVPPRSKSVREDGTDEPGSLPLRFELPTRTTRVDGKTVPTAGVVMLEILRKDALMLDNRAWDIVSPPRRPRGLLVTAGPTTPDRSPVVAAVQSLEFADFAVSSADGFAPKTLEGEGADGAYDVVVFDGFLPKAKLPPGRYLLLGVLPPVPGVPAAAGEIGDPAVKLNWVNTRHELMRAVQLDGVSVFKAFDWELPDRGVLLAEGVSGNRAVPLISEIIRDGSTFVTVAFTVNPRLGPVVNTDWWVQPGFAVFMQSAFAYLGLGAAGESRQVRPGRPIDLAVGPDVAGAKLTDPAGKTRDLTAAGGRIQHADTTRVGIYTLEIAGAPVQRFAVNLFDAGESDISPLPGGKLPINHDPVQAVAGLEEQRTDAWRWLLWGALALLAAEWWIYNRKVYI